MKIQFPKLKKNNKYFWLFIVLGSLFVLIFAFLAPFWRGVDVPWSDWGEQIINFIIAGFLSWYLFGYLLKVIIKQYNVTIKTLSIVEMVLLLLVDLYLVLGKIVPELNIIPVNGACMITGLAMYIRGVVEIFRAYLYQRNSSDRYPLYLLVINILLVTGGTWFMVNPFISDLVILWIFVSFILLIGLVFIGYGIYAKPKK